MITYLKKINIYHVTSRWFIVAYFALMLLFAILFTSSMIANSPGSFIFAFSNTITYPALYLSPAAAITFASIYLLGLS